MNSRWRSAAAAFGLLWIVWVCLHAFTIPPVPRPHLFDHAPGFPLFWREAITRAARGIAGATVVWLAAWNLGRTFPSCPAGASAETALEVKLVRLGVGVVTLAMLLLVLGWFGLYRKPVVAAFVIVCATPWRWLEWERMRAGLKAPIRVRRSDSPLVILAVAAIGLAAIAAFAPETEYDALWFHVWLPVRWLDAGRPIDIVEEYVSLYPGNWELLNGAALTLGGAVAAKLLQFACLPLLGAVTCAIGSHVAPSVRKSLLFALTVVSPIVLWEASTAYVDLALAWLIGLSALALLRLSEAVGIEGEHAGRRWLLAAAVLMGGALGVKHLALIMLALFAGVLFFDLKTRAATWTSVTATGSFCVVAVLLATPWYVRAGAASGNPVFPEMYSVFGASPQGRWSDGTEDALSRFKAHFGMGRSLPRLVRLPLDMTEHPAAFGGTPGPVFIAFIPLALLSRHRRRLVPLAFVVTGYVAVWASPLSSFQMRFLVPIVPFLAVLAGAGAEVLAELTTSSRSIGAHLGAVLLIAMLLLNLPPLVEWQERDRVGWDGWLTHVLRGVPLAVVTGAESERQYLTRTVPTYAAWEALDRTLPRDARVLTFVSGDQLYSTRARLWSDASMAYPAVWGSPAGHERDALGAAHRLGITHVLMDRRRFGNPELDRLALRSAAMRECCLTPILDDGRVIVYALRAEEPDSAPMSRR
jgi:hypothetical protein